MFLKIINIGGAHMRKKIKALERMSMLLSKSTLSGEDSLRLGRKVNAAVSKKYGG